jgi:hypothetical protein
VKKNVGSGIKRFFFPGPAFSPAMPSYSPAYAPRNTDHSSALAVAAILLFRQKSILTLLTTLFSMHSH